MPPVVIVPTSGLIQVPKAWVGKRVSVDIARPNASRKQRGWYWAYALPELMRHRDYTESECLNDAMQKNVHEGVLAERFGTMIDKVTGREIPAGRTAGQNTKENAEWQDWFCWYCAERHQLELKFRNEAEWLAAMK